MKPFNLKDALAGKPVVTRDGRKVEGLTHFPTLKKDYNSLPLVGVVEGYMRFWSDTVPSLGSGNPIDLFMVGTKKTMWGNVYRHVDNGCPKMGFLYPTKKEAEQWITAGTRETFLATVEVSWEE